MTAQEILNLMDLEKQIASEIRSKNPSSIPEADAVYWLAEQVSLRRAEALFALTGGVIPDPSAPALRIAFAGSSTPEKYRTDFTGDAVGSALVTSDGTNFVASGTTGKGLLAYAKIIAERTGQPAKYLMVGRGGTTLTNDWLPDDSANRADLVRGIKAMSGCDIVNWIGGFNDAFQNIIVDQASHLANIRAFVDKVRQETGFPNLKFVFGISQLYTGGNAVAPDAIWTDLRAAEMIATHDVNNYFGAHSYDLPQLSDGIHQAETSYPFHAARLAENGLAAMGLAGAVAARGPQIVAAAAVYTTRTDITVAHSGGSDITPTVALTGFRVSFDGGNTSVPATGTRIDATHISLAHAASGGAVPTVTDFTGRSPDVATVAHDNSPRALPINPSTTGIAAPTGSTGVAPPAADARVMKVAFSRTLAAPAGYNAFHDSGSQSQNSNAGLMIQLYDVNGAATGWTLGSMTTFQAGNDTQGAVTSGDTGPYPNAGTTGYIYNGAAGGADNGGVAASPTTMVLTAPAADRGKTVEFDLFGSRSVADRKTTYSANGQSQTIDAGLNTTAIATFTGMVPDANGQIVFTFAPASGYSYGYLNIQTIRVLG
jgi:hypothetical protein